MKPMSRAIILSFLFLTMGFSVSTVQASTNVSGTISTTTWNLNGSPYMVTGTVTIPAGATLTIEPGVEVLFGLQTGMYVDGTLVAVGVSDNPITFTGASAENGYWASIHIRGAGSADLEWCDVAYGGYNDYYNTWSGNNCLLKTGNGSLALKNTTIRNSSADGFGLQAGSSSVVMNNNVFRNNNRYGVKLGIDASFDDSTSDFSDNAGADLYADGGEITGPVVWSLKSDYSLYVSSTITITKSIVEPVKNGVLTIRAGTVVKVAQNSGLFIDGELLAQGNAVAPIYFTDWRDDTVGGDANKDGTSTAAPGWWASIYIRNTGSATLEWCNVAYGGYNDYWGSWSGNNDIYKTGSGNLAMTGCTVSNSSGNGMVVANSSGVTISQCIFTNNTRSGLVMNSGPAVATNCEFSNNGNYGILQEVNDSLVYTGNTFTGNTLGGVGVNGGTLNGNITWRAAGSPFRITGSIAVAAGATLTIEPGVTVQFSQSQGIWVDGTLHAVGTSDAPITFTGASEENGYWASIDIRGAGSADLEWCDVAYGGYNDYYNIWNGNNCLLKTGNGSLALRNTTIRNSSADGFGLQAGSSSVVMNNNVFRNNSRYGVKLGIDASFDDNTSDFSDNAGADLFADGGEITGPVVWSLKSDYSLYVSSTITIAKSIVEPVKNGVLTIRAGTVVKVAQNSGLFIDGEMLAQGNAVAPIYFTDWRDDTVGGDANKDGTSTGAPGWWASIYIRNAGSATLEWCNVAYGGYNDYWNSWSGNNDIYKTGSGNLAMTGCTVSNSSGNGMVVANSSGVTISQCIFTNNTKSGLVMNSGPAVATNCEFSNNGNYGILQEVNDSLVYTGNTFTGNTLGGVGVNGGTLNGNITWRAAGSPFRITGSIAVAAGATLTIEPGVTVQFNQSQGMWVDGTLHAVGTSDAPITFTGASEENGYWASIDIRGAGSADLEWCDVAYGGYNDYYNIWNGNNCLLKTGNGSLALRNTTIRNSSADGFGLQAGSSSVVMNNNVFRNNSRYGVKLGINASFDDNTSDFSDNAGADLYADGGTVTQDVAWSLKSDYSIHVGWTITINDESILTIMPGAVIKFAQFSGLFIDGEMLAQGNAVAPIYFTDWRDDTMGGDANKDGTSTGAPGWWASIYIRNAGSATLEWCNVAYGGYNDYYNSWNGTNGLCKTGSGNLDMTHCTISNINGNGLKVTGSTGGHALSRNTFSLNPTGVYILNQAEPIAINGNLIEANTNWGMINQNSAQVDAAGNWWGDETGPWHATINPDGQGDKVSGDVLLNPWRTSPSAGEILAPLRSGTLVQGDSLRFMGSRIEDAGAAYSWDFGEGRTSSDRNPGLVNFTVIGDYEVKFVPIINGEADPYPDTRTFTVVADAGPYADLQVTLITIPDSLAAGQPATIAYTARNAGDGPVIGTSWKDALYLSDDPYLDTGDERLGIVAVESDVAAGASYQNAIGITLPVTADDAARYLILSLNDEWQFVERHRLNNEHAAAVTVTIPSLENDESQLGNYGSGRVEQYYRMTADSGQNLVLTFDHEAPGLDVYVRYGALPTRSSYDFRLTGQELSIPGATSGQWYILIYGNTSSAGQYTIGYSMTDLALSGVSPNRHTTLTDVQLTLTGAGFVGPLAVELVAAGGSAYAADTVELDSFTQAVAVFPAGSVPAGTYALRVSHGGESDELPAAVEIIAGGTPKLETRLILPSAFGYHGLATVYVEYSNTGNASMPAPLLLVTATQNGQPGAIMTLDPTRLSSGFWTSAMPEGFSNSVQFIASGETPGLLQPGESCRVPVYYAGWQQPWNFSYPPFKWDVGVLDADNDTAVAWADMKDDMRPDYVRPDAWEVVWDNFTFLAGNTWGDYVAMLSRNALYLNRMGQRTDDIGPLLALAFRQADALSPLSTLADSADAAIKAPGIPIIFQRTYAQPISRRFASGTLGRGWTHNWQYTLEVGSDGTVVITGMTGTPRIFQPDSRYSGRYLAQPGDYGDLRSSDGGFVLTESNGVIKGFTGDGELSYVEDANGNRITCTYSGGRLTGLTHSSGPSLTITYNGAGYIGSVADHLGRQTDYTYSGEHLASAATLDGKATTYEYDISAGSPAQHALIEIGLPDGTHRFFSYDDQGRLESVYRDGNAETTTFSYGDGRVDATDALGHLNRLFFDYTGRLIKEENALGEAVQWTYDDLGNLKAITDPSGTSTTFAYDGKGNLTEISDFLRQKTKFTYSRTYNRLASISDAGGNRSVCEYDAKGNLKSVTYPDGSDERWSYNDLGMPTAWTSRRGNAVSYTYDTQGRIIGKTFADASTATYGYDGRGNLETAVNSEGTTTFTYDDDTDYLTRVDYPGGRFLTFAYDDAGRRQSSEDQLGFVVNYEYDAGRLSRLADGNKTIIAYEYDVLGRLVKKAMGNGTYAIYTYDAANRLSSLVNHMPDNPVLSRFEFTYDRRGRRTSMSTHYGVWTYTYDDLGQLTRAVLESADDDIENQDLSYEYDAMGNRVKTVENGQTQDCAANALNQVVSVGDRTYTYDADGNLVQDAGGPEGTIAYSYNDENQLIGVTKGGDTWQYAYDALGNRASIDENGTMTHFVVDPAGLGDVVGEYAGNGDVTARYAHGFGLLARITGSSMDYYTFDPMGNVSELTGTAGAIRNAYVYEPFGKALLENRTVANPFRFAGETGVMADEAGVHYMRARFYDPGAGRFMGVDPIKLNGGDLNFYRYAMNSPTTYIDPSGLIRKCQMVKGFFRGVGGAFTAAAGGLLSTTGWGAVPGIPMIGMGGVDLAQGIGMMGTAWEDEKWDPPSSFEHVFGGEAEIGKNVIDAVGGDPVGLAETATGWFCGWSTQPPPPPAPPAGAGASGGSGSAGSQDPNEKQTIAGYGDPNYVAGDTLVSYRINFENMASATAPAQFVTVRDALSANLDLTTVELLEVGFGNVAIPIPPGRQYFNEVTDYDYTDDDYDFSIKVRVEVWIEDGRVCANFSSIDPETGEYELPPSVDIGFLMPENDTGRGKGYVSFAVKPKSDLAAGTAIRNVATIQFDGSLEIDTNQIDPMDPDAGTDPDKEALITFDTAAPESAVSALPAPVHSPFTVSWSGQDDGAGIAGYDVYVQVNNGSWTLWKTHTQDTSAEYTGVAGSTYGFYTVATDNAGLSESAPAQADTNTLVISYEIGDANGDEGVNLADAILAAKIVAGVNTADATITLDADVDGDQKIGIMETIYILQRVAGLR